MYECMLTKGFAMPSVVPSTFIKVRPCRWAIPGRRVGQCHACVIILSLQVVNLVGLKGKHKGSANPEVVEET